LPMRLTLGMRAEGLTRFPQLSLTVIIGLLKYELMAAPSFLIMFFHMRMEAKLTMKVLVNCRIGGY
jgi:hypothetical protein